MLLKTVSPRLLIVGLLALSACGPKGDSSPSPEFFQAMNLGKAFLENKESAKAIPEFEKAVELRPDSASALRNLARGHLLARQSEAALAVLDSFEDSSVATAYLRGLTHARESRFKAALPFLTEAVRLDPKTAALRFQLALSLQSSKLHEQAEEQLLETVRLDPHHTGAHYRLASYARRAGNRVGFASRQRELQRIRQLLGEENRSAEEWETCRYTKAEAPVEGGAAPPPLGEVRFSLPDPRSQGAFAALRDAVAVAVLGMDSKGRYSLFLATAEGRLNLLTPGEDGQPVVRALALELPNSEVLRGGPVALAADFHDPAPVGRRFDPVEDTQTDLLLLSSQGAHLLRRIDASTFEEITQSAGLGQLSGESASWVDMEHDGDTDLWVAGPSGPTLWRNKGDGTFEEASEELGLSSEGAASGVDAGDWDGDGAVDLVVARKAQPSLVFRNRRAGRFSPSTEPPGPWISAREALFEELGEDGLADLVFLGDDRLRIVPSDGGEPVDLPLGDFKGKTMALIDYDNDGFLDLAVGGWKGNTEGATGEVRLWRNAGGGSWEDVSLVTGLTEHDLPVPRKLLALDLDGDGDSDLISSGEGGSRLLINEGGHQGGQLKVALLGSKSNPLGIGARLEARRAGFRALRTVRGPVTEIGLGGAAGLDSLQTIWTNGIVDNLVEVSTADPLRVVEQNVASGSCPYLYAWDGAAFRFVTDLLGNSPIGLSIRRGEVLPADPDEWVWVGEEASLGQRGGAYVLQVTEELREVLYLDEAHLVAVDHPPGVEVHPTDRLGPEPFPPSELWAMTSVRVPEVALGDDGLDRRAELAAIDGHFATPGEPLPPPMRGMTRPLALTLDFGPIDDLRHPMLALTGWLQYGDASTNIALSQSSSWAIVPPTLEVQSASGHWQTLDLVLGMPAGKTKTIVADLGGLLPPGSRRLRLTTSFEIRWDRIAIGERLPESALTLHPMAPARADLFFRGFSEISSRGPGHPTTPLHSVLVEYPPWRSTPEGWVTRYGGVLDLVTGRDERLVLLNGGDALELSFPADGLPPIPAGAQRAFFFHSVGWDKDSDHNVLDGERVEPLPVASDADDWQVRYNTRWVSRDRFARGGGES